MSHLWAWFWRLDKSRWGSGYGPQSLSYQEIESWCRLTGETPHRWEVDALMDMDVARRAAMTPKDTGDDTGLKNIVSGDTPKSAMDLFDRLSANKGIAGD